MREWCGCGSGIHGKPKQVADWRKNHRHATTENEPQKSGSSAQVERALQADYDHGPFITARAGFQPNEVR